MNWLKDNWFRLIALLLLMIICFQLSGLHSLIEKDDVAIDSDIADTTNSTNKVSNNLQDVSNRVSRIDDSLSGIHNKIIYNY